MLPPHIHLNPRNRVKIHVAGDKPYLKHKQHVQRYHPKPAASEYRKPRPPKPGDKLQVTKPAHGTHPGDKSKKPPFNRSVPRATKPGAPPVERRTPPVSREEREHNLKIQAEYFERNESGDINMVGSSPLETSTYQG